MAELGGGGSERSPWTQWTVFGEVRQGKSSIEEEQMFFSHPSCSSDTLRHRLAYFCGSVYRPSGIQLVLEKSLHPFPPSQKLKCLPLRAVYSRDSGRSMCHWAISPLFYLFLFVYIAQVTIRPPLPFLFQVSSLQSPLLVTAYGSVGKILKGSLEMTWPEDLPKMMLQAKQRSDPESCRILLLLKTSFATMWIIVPHIQSQSYCGSQSPWFLLLPSNFLSLVIHRRY